MATGKEQPKTLELTVKRGFGRPSKLTPDLIQQAWEYVELTTNFGYQLLPTIEGLSLAMKVSRETIYDWESTDASKDFSDIVKQLRSAQAEKLIQLSLAGKYNPMISKLMLSKHGYIEKQEIDQNLNVVQPILSGMAKQDSKRVEDVRSDPDNL